MAKIYTREQYEALVRSISLGVHKVQYGDKVTEYRSLDEMLQLKNAMEADLGMSSLVKRRRFISHTKGIK